MSTQSSSIPQTSSPITTTVTALSSAPAYSHSTTTAATLCSSVSLTQPALSTAILSTPLTTSHAVTSHLYTPLPASFLPSSSSTVTSPGLSCASLVLTTTSVSTGALSADLQMTTYRSYVSMLADASIKDEDRLKAIQKISEDFEIIVNHSSFSQFLDFFLKTTLKFLREGTPYFIMEYHVQQVRKLLLELIHRIPATDHLRPHIRLVVGAMFHLLEEDNEENVIVCLRIIIEIHKQFRPPYSPDIQQFLSFVKRIYSELPTHLTHIFERPHSLTFNQLSDIDLEALLAETYTTTTLHVQRGGYDGAPITYNLLPKSTRSLKVLAELPIIVVLMYQLCKQHVQQEVAEFIPLIMSTITLQPTQQIRLASNFNREILVDFMAAQIKTLSFLAYIIKIYQETVMQHSTCLVRGVLGLLMLCPPEVACLRKEILIATRYILQTDMRLKFVPYMDQLLDESVLLGNGWTATETCRTLAYSTLADLIHHVRHSLPLAHLAAAVTLFSRNIHDHTQPITIQTMSSKLLLNLVESVRNRFEATVAERRALLIRMLQVIVFKLQTFSLNILPVLFEKYETQTSACHTAPISCTVSTSSTAAATTAATCTLTPLSHLSDDCRSSRMLDELDELLLTPPPHSPQQSEQQSDTAQSTTERLIEQLDTCVGDSSVSFSSTSLLTSTYSTGPSAYVLSECKNLVKTLICTVKTVTWGCASCKSAQTLATADDKIVCNKAQFPPHETLVFIDLVHWALRALDIYMINSGVAVVTSTRPAASGTSSSSSSATVVQSTVRSREEKEVLEHFAGVFFMMHPTTFYEVFSTTIEFIVDRINHNNGLQVVANSLLANSPTSPVFATILVEFLLARMEEMGGSQEISNLYLKLFKLIFGSVSLLPADNEQMLRPYLHHIVHKSMEYSTTAKEPYNYFLLLRALFRSIGGGSHDLLYQEFLPLLPSLLQGLNNLQSALHRQHMRDLFVELCLTVPVRLSSLLPYLPMLMGPLVSALNGSQTLISQGLRTLELCVDNLQPDFLYEHIQPVRAQLMQALWRTVRNPTEQIAQNAFRVLGKFGGGNRRVLMEPQSLDFVTCDYSANGPRVMFKFSDISSPVDFPIYKVIDTAYTTLRSPTAEPFYREQAWKLVRAYVLASVRAPSDPSDPSTECDHAVGTPPNTRHTNSAQFMCQLFAHRSFSHAPIVNHRRRSPGADSGAPGGQCVNDSIQSCVETQLIGQHSVSAAAAADCDEATRRGVRHVQLKALTAMFVAAAVRELRLEATRLLVCVVNHFTLLACLQQAGPFCQSFTAINKHMHELHRDLEFHQSIDVPHTVEGPTPPGGNGLVFSDTNVLIDVLAAVMCLEENELCKPGRLAIQMVLGTASIVLGNLERACELPLVEYMAQKLTALCYERAWYTKLGGCEAIGALVQHTSRRWLLEHECRLMCALMFVITDLTGQVSSGTTDRASDILRSLLTKCAGVTSHSPGVAGEDQCDQSMTGDVGDTAGDTSVYHELDDLRSRSLAQVIIELMRQLTNANEFTRKQSIELLSLLATLYKSTVSALILPHRSVLADLVPPHKSLFKQQPSNAQIGIFEANTFCLALRPTIFSIDMSLPAHREFVDELISICESDDATLLKLACYQPTTLVSVRQAVLRCLTECHTVVEMRTRIFSVLYAQALNSGSADLQLCGFNCIRHFFQQAQFDMEIVHREIRPLLLLLGDHRSLTLPVISRLNYLIRLFPNTFKEKLCDQLVQHLRRWMESLVQAVHALGAGVSYESSSLSSTAAAGGTTSKGADKILSRNYAIVKCHQYQVCTAILDIFQQLPAASCRFVEILIRLVLSTDAQLGIEVSSVMRESLVMFLLKYPQESVRFLLTPAIFREPANNRFLQFIVKHKIGAPFRHQICQNTQLLVQLIFVSDSLNSSNNIETHYLELRFQAIRLCYLMTKHDQCWLISNQHDLVNALKQVWYSDSYHNLHQKQSEKMVGLSHWHEPRYLAFVLLHYFIGNQQDTHLLMNLVRAFTGRYVVDFMFLREFLEQTIIKTYSIEWRRKFYFDFLLLYENQQVSQQLKSKILQCVIIPCFSESFRAGHVDELVGGPPSPDEDSSTNVVSTFIQRLVDTERHCSASAALTADSARILLLQFSCLLIEYAAPHIHDVANKRQGNKLRRLMTFAWPCLMSKNCADLTTKYHGHLLLSHIIAKFAIHKRIVLQVFHSLLKAHAVEARTVVRQALDILTPAMPVRMEDGNTMLTHWTKKIIVEEGVHSLTQLVHMLQLVSRHYKIYYLVRHQLMSHMLSSIQRLAFSNTGTPEHRKLAVDLAEVIVRWQIMRRADEESYKDTGAVPYEGAGGDLLNPMDKGHADTLINLIMRIACQVNDLTPSVGSIGEHLCRRCVNMLKLVLLPQMRLPVVDLRLSWADKLLMSLESPQPNYANICTFLLLFRHVLSVLKPESIAAHCKLLQRSLFICITHSNVKVLKTVHKFLLKFMTLFRVTESGSFAIIVSESDPSDSVSMTTTTAVSRSAASTSSASSTVSQQATEDLDAFFAQINKICSEGLLAYEKTSNSSAAALYGPLLILKALCSASAAYIDRFLFSAIRVYQRLSREHVSTNSVVTSNTCNEILPELLITLLELVKSRLNAMSMDVRKSFIGGALVSLIERTSDAAVLSSIIATVFEWLRGRTSPSAQCGPTIRESCVLLVKLSHCVEKRFADNAAIVQQFLDVVYYIYSDQYLKTTELTMKLETAFLSGLRCDQPQLRMKFYSIYDSSIQRSVIERIIYILTSQNWEQIGQHYWIKQCNELVLGVAECVPLQLQPSRYACFPSFVSIACSAQADTFARRDGEGEEEEGEKFYRSLCSTLSVHYSSSDLNDSDDHTEGTKLFSEDSTMTLDLITRRQAKFIASSKLITSSDFIAPLIHLSHFDQELANSTWYELFPRIWSALTQAQQKLIMPEVGPFIISGTHNIQRECNISSLRTFVESVMCCDPPIEIRSPVLRFLGINHKLWHAMALALEKSVARTTNLFDLSVPISQNIEPLDNPCESVLDLCLLYEHLCDDDMCVTLWRRIIHMSNTALGLCHEQLGLYPLAQSYYELSMSDVQQKYANNPAPAFMNQEISLLEQRWIESSKQLNQWDTILDYGNSSQINNTMLVAESAWHVPNWSLMKEAIQQLEGNCPREDIWKLNLYRGYLAVCHPSESHPTGADKLVELATTHCIKEWRMLPDIVSRIHVVYLQAAQQIMELQEGAQLHQNLNCPSATSTAYDLKALIKTWRNRLPIVADHTSHWSDIIAWRQHHYQFIISHYSDTGGLAGVASTAATSTAASTTSSSSQQQSVQGVHASAQAVICFAKIARKHGLSNVCLETLHRVHTIPSVPIVDCFQKIRQQVKCYLNTASAICASNSNQQRNSELQQGLDVLESTNMKYFTKEIVSEFYALKGHIFSLLNDVEEANRCFSSACQMDENLTRAWSLWGEFLESAVVQQASKELTGGADPSVESGVTQTAVSAVVCFLQACKHQKESKCHKYMSKILWLLSYNDEKNSIGEALQSHSSNIPVFHWLPWIPQLLLCLARHEGKVVLDILIQVGRSFAQTVYFPTRTLYLTLKIRQHDKFIANGGPNSTKSASESPSPPTTAEADCGDSNASIRACDSMWRCSRIMQTLRDTHPTIICSLEAIVNQLVWFRESWYEQVLGQLRQALHKCLALAFDHRDKVATANISQHTMNFIRKLVATFGTGVENVEDFSTSANSEFSKQIQAIIQDPVFQCLKSRFESDFNFSVPASMRLHNLIGKLKKWIKVFENMVEKLPRQFLIDEKCRWLSNFTLQTAEIHLPGECIHLKHTHHMVRITRFVPRVDIVQKHGSFARRLYIRGNNGKTYAYLVINDKGLSGPRSQERLLQLLRIFNQYMKSSRETSRRLLRYTVPRVVPVLPTVRLVEDCVCSTSLLDIYERHCRRVGVDTDRPVCLYYEQLARAQMRVGYGAATGARVAEENYVHVTGAAVPSGLLLDWARLTYPDACHFWTFRQNMTYQISLLGFAEHVLHLSSMSPEMLHMHCDSGQVAASYFRFDLDNSTGELNAERAVPFRLTPNLTELLTQIGIAGPLVAAMMVVARCLSQPNHMFLSSLRAILKDEIISWYHEKPDTDFCSEIGRQQLISLVTMATNKISARLHKFITCDVVNSEANRLVAIATDPKNLAQMDPSWHPWL